MRFPGFLALSLAAQGATSHACKTDEDCSLNGICSRQWPWSDYPNGIILKPRKVCKCDPGWFGDDCGRLDLRPAGRINGYNHSADGVESSHFGPYGNSSWGGQIFQDPKNPKLFHLFASQFADGCGLSGWRPHSFVLRAESRNGPQGPYQFAQSVSKPFRHNPQVIWSPADEKYLLYTIGVDDNVKREECTSLSYTQWPNNISVSAADDLQGPWTPFEMVLSSKEPHSTNPAPWPLWTPEYHTSKIVLGVEDLAIFIADKYNGEYELVHTQMWNTSEWSPTWTEDSFFWQDKRGHWHALAHWMIDLVEHDGQKWPRVGAHVFAKDLTGPWHFHLHEAFNSTVTYTDGSSQTLDRRERAKIFFSDDGEMTPLYLINGVQEMGERSRSSTVIQPIGEKWKKYEKRLGFR
ncbi:uncharacterized protein BJX67DRAFT_374525 [Aspergillus lucknowensis]|uniref:EGF-like domain-containing protein n=1 Tax=Aspergillus lucknowensis TaxID=176173 RepID=A0ABR4LFZ7_9EURO